MAYEEFFYWFFEGMGDPSHPLVMFTAYFAAMYLIFHLLWSFLHVFLVFNLSLGRAFCSGLRSVLARRVNKNKPHH